MVEVLLLIFRPIPRLFLFVLCESVLEVAKGRSDSADEDHSQPNDKPYEGNYPDEITARLPFRFVPVPDEMQRPDGRIPTEPAREYDKQEADDCEKSENLATDADLHVLPSQLQTL